MNAQILMHPATTTLFYKYVPVITAVSGSLACPIPYLLFAVTMTTTITVNTPSGSDGAVNVSIVVELSTFMIVPLWYT